MRTAEIARKRFASALAAYPIWAKRRRVRTHWAARKSTKAKRPAATTARTRRPFHPVRVLASASTGPGAAPPREDPPPSRDPPHEHIDEPARKEAEPRERVRDPLLRSPSRRRHARHLRRRRGAAGERGRTGS